MPDRYRSSVPCYPPGYHYSSAPGTPIDYEERLPRIHRDHPLKDTQRFKINRKGDVYGVRGINLTYGKLTNNDCVLLYLRPGRKALIRVDEMVVDTFMERLDHDNGVIVAHLDGDRLNNDISNLEQIHELSFIRRLEAFHQQKQVDTIQTSYLRHRGVPNTVINRYIATSTGNLYSTSTFAKLKFYPYPRSSLEYYQIQMKHGDRRYVARADEFILDSFPPYYRPGHDEIVVYDESKTNHQLENLAAMTPQEYTQYSINYCNEKYETEFTTIKNVPNIDATKYYLVSKLGQIYSMKTKQLMKISTTTKTINGKTAYESNYIKLANGTDDDGFGININFPLHILVLSSFSTARPPNHICNHINHISTDNRLDNLEWVTPSQNAKLAHQFYNIEQHQRKGMEALAESPTPTETTKWKEIGRALEDGTDFEGYYIGHDGCLERRGQGTTSLVPMYDWGGYRIVNLLDKVSGKTMTRFVHRLVCYMHHGPPPSPEKCLVDHKRQPTSNNHMDNLRWATYHENMAYAQKYGAIVTCDDDPTETMRFECMKDAVLAYGLTRSSIRSWTLDQPVMKKAIDGVQYTFTRYLKDGK